MKISGIQMLWLMFSMLVGMTLLRLTQTISEAKQDSWLAMLIAGGTGVGVTWLTAKVSLLYPGQTFIQYTKTILGKWLGTAVILTYIFQWITVTGVIFRRSLDFIHLALFHNTPLFVLVCTMLLVVAYATYEGGIEGIARCSEVIGPVICIMLLLIFALSINNLDWRQLLPIYVDTGLKEIWKGSLSPGSLLGESAVVVVMLISFMTVPEKGPSRAMWGVGLAFVSVFVATLFVIMTFGPNLSARMVYPFYEVVRFIFMMEFIQNVDVVVIVIWMTSFFIKLCLYLFVTSYGTAQLLHVKNWRKMIWIISFVVLILALVPRNELFSIQYNQKYIIPIVVPFNYIFVPLLLWVVGVIRKKAATEGTKNEANG
ncbi:endospore germination permease [Paenibacillus solisilvae]|uniref:Endospore germination permease n=1 Tax=Paenibacillus solisilvae TaxID=2486751 RepID=A0ABW0W520_9BACL